MSAATNEVSGKLSSVPVAAQGGLWLARLTAGLAVGMSLILAWVSWRRSAPPGCGPASPCEQVLGSRWSSWLGVPVAVPAAALYATILGATLFLGPRQPWARRRRAWAVVLAGATAAGVAAVYFIVLQWRVVGGWCAYCLGVHACGLLLAGWAWGNRPRGSRALGGSAAGGGDGSDRSPRPAPEPLAGRAFPAAAAGLAVTAALAAGQWGVRPRLYRVQAGTDLVDLEPGGLPVVGAVTAPHFVAVLGDYTCDHCRRTHRALRRAVARYGSQVAVITLPLPLEAECNPAVKTTDPHHRNACALARLALAVWVADPKAFAPMDDWLFESDAPRDPAAARLFAASLVGEQALARAEADPRVEQIIRQDVQLCARAGGGVIPKVMIGTVTISGEIDDPDALARRIGYEWELKPSDAAPAQPAP